MSARHRSTSASGPSRVERLHADDGVTVVEMLVSSFVLGLGVVGMAVLLVFGARTASLAEIEGDAAAVASGELEIIRSLDFDMVGIEPSASGFVPTVDGLPTVTEAAGNLVEPLGKVVVGDVTFGIERSVTWATVGLDPRAYKIVVIVVEWDTPSGARSITMQTGLHQGLSGV